MALADDLKSEVSRTFQKQWAETKTTKVPAPEDVTLGGNYASALDEATVLYADLDGSTNMVDERPWQFSAKIYKTFLVCAAKLIRAERGEITAYDGDRIMGVFYGGDDKNTRSVRCALKINHAVTQIINPAIQAQYPQSGFVVKHVVGIDTSPLRAARTGVRGGNDLVWVGRAANYAAKLTAIPLSHTTWITSAIYNNMNDEVKHSNNKNMWEKHTWNSMNKMEIWGSTWRWGSV